MSVDPNRSAPRAWIAGCPSTTSVDTTPLRRHSWHEPKPGEWECAVESCGCAVDEAWFRTMDVADVITPTSLDVAISIWISYNPRHSLVPSLLTCPRY